MSCYVVGQDVVNPSTSLVRRARGSDLDELDEEELEGLAGYREPVRSYAHAPMVCSPRARVGFPQQVLRGPHP